jgi:nucleotide-binding universal stress UspA family protein
MSSKPILLATDGSPTAGEATREAIELAKALNAPLLVVTAWNIACTPYGPVPPRALPLDDVEGEAKKILEATRKRAEDAGVEVETILRRGAPAPEILDVASTTDPQLIVMGSHGWGPVRRFLFGSVSTIVLHDAACPFLIARPPEEIRDEAEEPKELAAV